MAENASIASARGTVAAIDPASVQAAWDRAYFEYQRFCLIRDAYSEIGPLAAVNADWDDAKQKIETNYGSVDCPAAKKEWKKLSAPIRDELDCKLAEYGNMVDRATEAMLNLMRTPCPDLKAARTKFEICRFDYGEGNPYDDAIWQAIDADLRHMVQPSA